MRFDALTGKPIIELSHSGLVSFATCPKRWAFNKLIIHRENVRESGIAAEVGSAMHEGVQTYFITRDVDAAVEALALRHPVDIDHASASQYSLEASIITLEQCIENCDFTAYELATFVKDGIETPAVEIPFRVEIELEHILVHVRGLVDLVLLSNVSDRFLAVDIKTTTPHGAAHFEEKYQLDHQLTSYGVPLQGLLGLDGPFQVGVLGVIQSDYEPKFPAVIHNRTPNDVEDYHFYLLDKCQQIQRYYMLGKFPRHPHSCKSYNRLCNYHSVCWAGDLESMQDMVNPSRITGESRPEPEPMFVAQLKLEG